VIENMNRYWIVTPAGPIYKALSLGIDVKPNERIEFGKKRKKQSTHGWTHGRTHGRAARAETACYSG